MTMSGGKLLLLGHIVGEYLHTFTYFFLYNDLYRYLFLG